MTSAILTPMTISRNAGDNREWSVCSYVGAPRAKHDSSDYRNSSDIVLGERHISVKSSAFTLMSGNMCEGETTMDGIWNVYERNTHSNEVAYVTEDFTAYFMTMDEFKTSGRSQASLQLSGWLLPNEVLVVANSSAATAIKQNADVSTTKTTTFTFPPKPSATTLPSPFFRRLQSFFTVRMIEDCGGIFGLVSPGPWIEGRLFHSPNIVGDFDYGWYHGRKLRKACAMVLLMYWKISPTAFPRLLSVFWQGGIRNHEVPGYAHQSYPLSPHSRFPSRSSGILLRLTYCSHLYIF